MKSKDRKTSNKPEIMNMKKNIFVAEDDYYKICRLEEEKRNKHLF